MDSKKINNIKHHMEKEYGVEASYSYKYYQSDKKYIPVYNRKPLSKIKAMSQVNVHADFMKTIVEQKVGYIGKSNIICNTESESLNDKINDYVRKLEDDNLSAETIRWTAASGISHRLLYFQDNAIYIKNLRGEQVAYIGDEYDPQLVFVFDEYEDILTDKKEERLRIYDDTYVYYYKKFNNKWLQRIPDGMTESMQAHLFSKPPVIPFTNNEEYESDCPPNIRALINAYDETQSNVLSEIKAHRLATLMMWGDVQTDIYRDRDGNAIIDNNGNPIHIPLEKYLEEGYAMRFPTDDDGRKVGGAEFLVKDLQDDIVEHNLDRLRKQIFDDSRGVDKESIIQGSNIRVLAINAAYDAFYKKCQTFEKYMTKSLQRQYKLIFDRIRNGGVRGITLTDTEVEMIEIDVMYENNVIEDPETKAKILQMYMQVFPVEEAYRKAGIDNPEILAQQYIDQTGLGSTIDLPIGE